MVDLPEGVKSLRIWHRTRRRHRPCYAWRRAALKQTTQGSTNLRQGFKIIASGIKLLIHNSFLIQYMSAFKDLPSA